jgi:Ca2+-binding RTX toxin-like protein
MTLILGTNLNEILYGETFDDLIHTLRGDDTAYGGEGNDSIYGGQPSSTYDDGNDLLFGEMGWDVIYGGTGDDSLFGNQESDYLYGELDNDYLHGGQNFDYLHGGQGDDTLDGGRGLDILVGGVGSDTLTGDADSLDWFLYEQLNPDPLSSDVDTITDFITGSDKIVLNADVFGLTKIDGPDPNLVDGNEVNPGHPLRAIVFGDTQFYQLDLSEFAKVDELSDLTSATAKIVTVIEGFENTNILPAPYFEPAIYYNDGTGSGSGYNGTDYQLLAVFRNGAIPDISNAINDFLIY